MVEILKSRLQLLDCILTTAQCLPTTCHKTSLGSCSVCSDVAGPGIYGLALRTSGHLSMDTINSFSDEAQFASCFNLVNLNRMKKLQLTESSFLNVFYGKELDSNPGNFGYFTSTLFLTNDSHSADLRLSLHSALCCKRMCLTLDTPMMTPHNIHR